MKLLQTALGLVLATIVHTGGVKVWTQFPVFVDPFLFVAVFHGLGNPPLLSAIGGSVIGLAHDSLSGGTYGLYGFSYTAVAYAISQLRQRLLMQRPLQIGFLFFLAAGFQIALLSILGFLFLTGFEPASARAMLIQMMVSGILGGALVSALNGLRGLRGRRPRRQRLGGPS